MQGFFGRLQPTSVSTYKLADVGNEGTFREASSDTSSSAPKIAQLPLKEILGGKELNELIMLHKDVIQEMFYFAPTSFSRYSPKNNHTYPPPSFLLPPFSSFIRPFPSSGSRVFVIYIAQIDVHGGSDHR
jgi:hypothetical protein